MKTRNLIKDNPKEILKLLLKRLHNPYNEGIYQSMKEHPDFPSFLSFQHILKKEGIDSIALNATEEELRFDLPKPILVHIKPNDGMFLLLEKIDEEYAYIINERSQLEKQPKKDFFEIWTGKAMVFDVENIKRNKTSIIDKLNLFLNKIKQPFIILSFILILIFFLIKQERSFINLLYLIEFSIGISFSVLLLMEYFDNNNPFVKKFCISKNNKKVNCGSILNSKDAYFMNLFSWSDIGFIYFSIFFLLGLIFPENISIPFSILGFTLAFPYVFYSIYYQKFIAKNWCTLCLAVQTVIFSAFITSIFAYKYVEFKIELKNILSFALLSCFVISLFAIFKTLIKSHKRFSEISDNFKKLKHDNKIINLLFLQQKTYPSINIEKIEFGNNNWDNCITIIFSPICEPCIYELEKLLPLLETKEKIRIEILFLLNKKDNPIAFKIAKYMLSIYYKDKNNFWELLKYYVNNYPKSKYPLLKYSNQIKEQVSTIEETIKKEEKWCIDNKIMTTPRILLNYKELPSVYTTEDLDYII